MFGTLLPVFLRRSQRLRVPEWAFSIVKYFGSGVIIATAFIHLLAPSFEALSSECLGAPWDAYPWTPAIAMFSVFAIFLTELIAHRAGASFLKRRGLRTHDAHSQAGNPSSHTTHGLHTQTPPGEEPGSLVEPSSKALASDEETAGHSYAHDVVVDENVMAQIIGVAILEFGVIVHSLIIGLTLAVNDDFITLFVVLIFHQMFEGLGLGSRLSSLPLPHRFAWVPYTASCIYAAITPLGVAIGLGVRTTYNPDSANALIVSGVLDALSAGVLLYTGLVELLAHDFLFNREMAVDASNAKVAWSLGCVLTGAGLMSLLGYWA